MNKYYILPLIILCGCQSVNKDSVRLNSHASVWQNQPDLNLDAQDISDISKTFYYIFDDPTLPPMPKQPFYQ